MASSCLRHISKYVELILFRFVEFIIGKELTIMIQRFFDGYPRFSYSTYTRLKVVHVASEASTREYKMDVYRAEICS
jgi:hypothetical protein